MSKKQVVLLSFLVAIPALGLLAAIALGATTMGHGAHMFSGLMTVIVAVTGILVLGIGISPFAIMAWYPTDGFASLAPLPTAPPPGTESDDEEFEDDDDDEFGSADDGFEEDGFEDEDSGEELFDDGYDDDEFDDDLGDFDDDEDEWE